MITENNLPVFSKSQFFRNYFFEISTDKQKVLACLKYELRILLDEMITGEIKRDIYKLLAAKYQNISFRRIENIANSKEFKNIEL